MIVLGIESTCDETACAIVKDGCHILSNVVSSQIDLHEIYGGVVPELACRRHVEVILPTIDQALESADVTLDQIDLIAVAHGPGLIGALLIGLNTAKTLALALNRPLVAVNHIEAHLYAAMMPLPHSVTFPSLGVILSGGHSAIVLMHQIGDYTLLGQTVDDAIGEAYDKVAKILGKPYPGGPQIEKMAERADSKRFVFRTASFKENPYNMSFSGLKTAVLYATKGVGGKMSDPDILAESDKCDVAAAFQEAALSAIVKRCRMASSAYHCPNILLGGGVTSNQRLKVLLQQIPDVNLFWPARGLEQDNGAMIAGLGYHQYLAKGASDLSISAATRIAW